MSKFKGSNHDSLFKNVLMNKTVAKQLIEKHVNHEIVARLDLETLELMPTSFVERDLRAKCCDVLYRCRMDGLECYIYILLEHQSTPSRYMPIRMVNYLSNIWLELVKQKTGGKIPYVLPIVIYNGRVEYPYPTSLFELIDGPSDLAKRQFDDIFQLVDLSTIEDEQLRSERWSDITLFFMKNITRRNLMSLLSSMREILVIADHNEGSDFIVALFSFIMSAGDVKEEEITEFFIKHFTAETKGAIMTTAEQIFNRGRVEGEHEGELKGKREIVRNMKSLHYEPEIIARITNLPLDEVQKIIA